MAGAAAGMLSHKKGTEKGGFRSWIPLLILIGLTIILLINDWRAS